MTSPFVRIAALSLLAAAPFATAVTLPGPDGPTAKQSDMVARGYGMFIHYGINTFTEKEWSDGTLPVTAYNPTKLDCDQWVRTAKEAGFRYVVLVTKHHDGFCLWDSKVTAYDVGATAVKTDVVGEVAKACAKYGVKFGIYYSLWDRHEPSYKDDAKYVDFMKAQLTELLTNYGPVCELWFDGGWMKKKDGWNIPELYALVNRLQPGCSLSTNFSVEEPGKANSNLAPEQQKDGDTLLFWPTDFRLLDPMTVRLDDPKFFTRPDGVRAYLPYEHTICISEYWNWFQKSDIRPVRKLDELEELFYWCTANDNLLVVNVPPDKTGRLLPNESARVIELADRLGIRGGTTPLPTGPVNQALGAKVEASSSWDAKHGPEMAVDTRLGTHWSAADKDVTPTLTVLAPEGKPFVFDRLAIHEMRDGRSLDSKAEGAGFSVVRDSRIQEYTVEIFAGDEWRPVYYGYKIDAAQVINFPALLTAEKILITVKKATRAPGIRHVSVARRDSVGVRTAPKPVN